MAHASKAVLAQSAGRSEEAADLFSRALGLEVQALRPLPLPHRVEPTHSVLCRSAATLALDCGNARLAEKLACEGLAGDPPPPIDDELRQVLAQAQALRQAPAASDVSAAA
ncbi:MAG: hypothetical protein HZB16_19970 [Armatimonadetes bacterium]|nr:hypothetical protein [Armatimonadota bacterium]